MEEEEPRLKRNNLNSISDNKEKINKIPLIDYDKYRKMDSNFFNKNASKIQSAMLNKKNNLNEERFDKMSLKNSMNQSLNFSNIEENNSNLGQNNEIVMKKIVLQKPETKEDRSVISLNSSHNCKIINI